MLITIMMMLMYRGLYLTAVLQLGVENIALDKIAAEQDNCDDYFHPLILIPVNSCVPQYFLDQ